MSDVAHWLCFEIATAVDLRAMHHNPGSLPDLQYFYSLLPSNHAIVLRSRIPLLPYFMSAAQRVIVLV